MRITIEDPILSGSGVSGMNSKPRKRKSRAQVSVVINLNGGPKEDSESIFDDSSLINRIMDEKNN